MIIIIEGIANANINMSKYLFIIIDEDEDEDEDEDVDLARFWILNPKINDDVPINKETIVRTFCVRPGMRVIGVFVYCCCCPSANTKVANRLFIINT
jgi:hypothetical protein